MNPDEERYLRRAIQLAVDARAGGHAPFGSLLVGPDGTVLAEDHNTVGPDGDIIGFPRVPQEGPALYDEARAAVAGYYT